MSPHFTHRALVSVLVVSFFSLPLASAAPQEAIESAAPEAAAQARRADERARNAEHEAAKAESKASRASEKATLAIDEAASATQKASDAGEKASEAGQKATSASDKATKASEKAEDAAKKAEVAADKATEAAEKIDVAAKKADQAVAVAETAASNKSSVSLANASNRMSHQVGAYLSMWGDPYPTTLGINLAYNVYDFTRVNIGLGSDTTEPFKTATAGMGVKFLVPGWPLTPVLGMNISFTKTDDSQARNIRGFNPSGAHLYSNVGVDWETGIGLNFAVGYIFPLQNGAPGSYYLNAGIFL